MGKDLVMELVLVEEGTEGLAQELTHWGLERETLQSHSEQEQEQELVLLLLVQGLAQTLQVLDPPLGERELALPLESSPLLE